MRRFWLILLPHGRCYMLLHLLNSFCVAHFARVFPACEGFGYFVTSWPMLHINNSRHLAREYINNIRHLARKYARIFVRGHCLFREANSFPSAMLEENCELRGTDNVQGQISEHIFAPNGDYCLYYPSNLLRNARSFENWGVFSDIPQF